MRFPFADLHLSISGCLRMMNMSIGEYVDDRDVTTIVWTIEEDFRIDR